jgi:hypothetical protein
MGTEEQDYAALEGLYAGDETRTALELYDRMLTLYPDWINPGSLLGSANAAKAPRHATVGSHTNDTADQA